MLGKLNELGDEVERRIGEAVKVTNKFFDDVERDDSLENIKQAAKSAKTGIANAASGKKSMGAGMLEKLNDFMNSVSRMIDNAVTSIENLFKKSSKKEERRAGQHDIAQRGRQDVANAAKKYTPTAQTAHQTHVGWPATSSATKKAQGVVAPAHPKTDKRRAEIAARTAAREQRRMKP
jgi:hypothetical protein